MVKQNSFNNPAVQVILARGAGHPWDNRPGWDRLYLHTDSPNRLEQAVAAAERKFWLPWIVGTLGEDGPPAAVMYKPSGATAPWEDQPE